MTDILPGAEPWSADGGPSGALCIHGFTGNPGSMRGVAEAFAAAGFAVELPAPPRTRDHGRGDEGHPMGRLDRRGRGGVPAPVGAAPTRSSSPGSRWAAASRCGLALQHPEVAGIVCINPATQPQPDGADRDAARDGERRGRSRSPGSAPTSPTLTPRRRAYDETPLRPAASRWWRTAWPRSAPVTGRSPARCCCSPARRTTSSSRRNGDFLAETFGGPVERRQPRAQLPRRHARLRQGPHLRAAVSFGRKVTS